MTAIIRTLQLLAFMIALPLATEVMAQKAPEGAGGGAASGRIKLPPEKSSPVVIPFAGQAPVIDGKADDEIWGRGARFADFYQTSPGDNTAPSRRTEVYMLYDRDCALEKD